MEPWAANRRFEPKTLAFPTLAAAAGYAERHGYDYRIEPPARRSSPSMRRRRGEQQLPRSWLEGLGQRWAHDAARLGWNERAMFGLDPLAPAVRDSNGLLPALALTAFRRPVGVLK